MFDELLIPTERALVVMSHLRAHHGEHGDGRRLHGIVGGRLAERLETIHEAGGRLRAPGHEQLEGDARQGREEVPDRIRRRVLCPEDLRQRCEDLGPTEPRGRHHGLTERAVPAGAPGHEPLQGLACARISLRERAPP